MNSTYTVSKRNQNPNFYSKYINFKGDCYYSVNLRMYIHFNPIRIIYPEEEGFVGSYFAPIPTTFLNTTRVDAKTFAQQHSFMINSKKAVPTIDKYIENNIEKYIGRDIWNLYKEKRIYTYLKEVKNRYNVILDESFLDYSIQYVWEVESAGVNEYEH